MPSDVIHQIIPCPTAEIFSDATFNCRGHIAPIDVVTLAADIDAKGLIEPIILAPYADHPPFKYRIVAGHRRFAAMSLLLKRTSIPAIIRPDLADELKARLFNLSENLHREDLNVLQEAQALQKIFESGLTEEEIAKNLGKSRGWLQIRICLLKLPADVQKEAAAKVITQPQIRELYTVLTHHGEQACFEATKAIKEHREREGKTLSVNPTRKLLKAKIQRRRPEIFEMMALIRNNLGNGPMTVLLAWVAGEVSTQDVLDSLRAEAKILEKDFIIPEGTFLE